MKDLKNRIGSLLMTGIGGQELKAEEEKLLREVEPAGVILFKRNYKDIAQLTVLVNRINAVLERPLIGVDQEGGRIIRLGHPFSQFPPQRSFGKYFESTGSVDFIKDFARILSLELKAAGINLCFTPVADIMTNRENRVIGDRAFSNKVVTVSELASAVVTEMNAHGVISCAKHFPGHGDTFADSHEELPSLGISEDLLLKREVLPFKRCIAAGVPMIMTAHILFEKIDAKKPATLSGRIIEGLLRKRLGYRGPVITDDMDMKAVSGNYRLEEASCLSLDAGVYIVLICRSYKDLYSVKSAIIRRAEKDGVFREKLRVSVKRVDKLKKSFIKDRSNIDQEVSKKKIRELAGADLIEKLKSYA
jgi:beta-N-acetylhexosaminidase